ncbi:solute carrier family 23 protein, partial [Haemophilus parainfluenzae]|uniref:solute carrier family 23 protein n=1 Tax=Haemophilus parainfluenzae TaxID=729 RepID=UPI00157EF2EE
AILGTSTVTTFAESAAGVAEGGRTGLTAVVAAVMFLVALLFVPIFEAIPAFATAPALMIVGVMMMAGVKNIRWDDLTEAIPAFV